MRRCLAIGFAVVVTTTNLAAAQGAHLSRCCLAGQHRGLAATAARQQVSATFTSHRPDTHTGVTVTATYTHGDVPAPYALVHADDSLPAGTTINNKQLPRCTANIDQFELLGPSACPAASIVGSGYAVFDFGVPFGLSRLHVKITVINAPGQIWFLGQVDGITQLERGGIDGSAISINVPRLPGLGKEGAVIDHEQFTITAASGLLTTPKTCTKAGWVFHRTHTYVDGVTQVAKVKIPCSRRVKS